MRGGAQRSRTPPLRSGKADGGAGGQGQRGAVSRRLSCLAEVWREDVAGSSEVFQWEAPRRRRTFEGSADGTGWPVPGSVNSNLLINIHCFKWQ